MTLFSLFYRSHQAYLSHRRDQKIPLPEQVMCFRNMRYSEFGKFGLLDVYCPEGTDRKMPTVLYLHSGGYVSGCKEKSRRFCMALAKQGFSVVNINYRLSPRWHFPAPLEDCNLALQWVCRNWARYHLDPDNILLVGMGAGGQIGCQYGSLVSGEDYASLFGLTVPPITLRAAGFLCGFYDLAYFAVAPRKGYFRDYLGRDIAASDPRLHALLAITESYPPTFLATCQKDYLRSHAAPLADLLKSKGVLCTLKSYAGSGSHFCLELFTPEAKECIRNLADFLKTHCR